MSKSAASQLCDAAPFESCDINTNASALATTSDRDTDPGARTLRAPETASDGQQNTPIWVAVVLVVAVILAHAHAQTS